MNSLFQAGGALPADHPSYVERSADRQTVQEAQRGNYLCITAPRQVGKTSLLNRLAAQVDQWGWRCCRIDLTKFLNFEKAEWFEKLGRKLGQELRCAPERPLQNQIDLEEFLLRQFGLAHERRARLALAFDEIGALRDCSFSDEFLGTLRALYNHRDGYPGRLVIAFAGAVDTDTLVSNPDISPFNVSTKIQLDDFTPEETRQLTCRLDDLGVIVEDAVHDCIYEWTSGQPYLTQFVCKTLGDWVGSGRISTISPDGVKQVVQESLCCPRPRDNNLGHIRRAIRDLREPAASLWNRLIAGEVVSAHEPGYYALYLTGAVTDTPYGDVRIRNRIYQQALQSTKLPPPPPAHPFVLLTRIVPTAFCYQLHAESFPLVTVALNCPEEYTEAEIRVQVFIEGYSDEASRVYRVSRGRPIDIPILPQLRHDAIAQLDEIRPVTLRVIVEQTAPESRLIENRTEPIKLHARNTALLAVKGPDGRIVDLTDYLTAWVTPHKPEIEGLLRQAADYHPQKSFIGYQGATTLSEGAKVVREQAHAIFTTLKEKTSLRYINSPWNLGKQAGQITQRVRLPTECLAPGGSANCIDGTVLFASLLELGNIDPLLVIVPGHAFVGWRVWRNVDRYEFLETTLIGYDDFDKAQQAAQDQYDNALMNGYFDRELFHPDGFARVIDVRACRAKDIIPL
jgi:hypothetical protein